MQATNKTEIIRNAGFCLKLFALIAVVSTGFSAKHQMRFDLIYD